MEISSAVVKHNYDEDDITFDFHFTFKYGCLKSVVVLTEPYINSYEKWTKMSDAIKNNEKYELGFYCGNGQGDMECNGESVLFTAKPSGAGGDVSVSAVVSLAECKQELVENLEKLINHEYAQTYWKTKK